MPTDWYLRPATLDDAERILGVYGPYVRDTVISFETEVPSVPEYRDRMAAILARYPFLVAETEAGEIIGYCYASAFKARKAYDWAVETSIYLAPEAQGRGVASELYAWLEELLVRQGITNMNACIAVPNPASTRFHERRGFLPVARFTKCGYKLGTWQDMIWMEKFIAEHPEHPEPVVPFPELDVEPLRRPRCREAVLA